MHNGCRPSVRSRSACKNLQMQIRRNKWARLPLVGPQTAQLLASLCLEAERASAVKQDGGAYAQSGHQAEDGDSL